QLLSPPLRSTLFPYTTLFRSQALTMSYYRRKFSSRVLQHRSRLRRFLSKVERNPPATLDLDMERIDAEIWQEVDCLACSNCCRRSEEHTSELQSRSDLVCRLL